MVASSKITPETLKAAAEKQINKSKNSIKKLDKKLNKKIKQTVVEWLNGIDYSIDPTYVPSKFAFKFINFIKLVNGAEGEKNKTPVVHYKMLDNIAGKKQDTINLCHRGIAKTTLLGEYLFLYIAVFGRLPDFGKIEAAIYVSDSIENGVKNMRRNLECRWDRSSFLKKYIPRIRMTDVRWEFHSISGSTFICKGYGAKTGVRGGKELATRPTLAVLDDLISDEDARSEVVRNSVEDTVYSAVEYALDPRYKIIWSGTPFNAKDPLYKAVESGAWFVNVYPVCERFPCTREEFKGSWEDRFDYDYVYKKWRKAFDADKIASFNQELMLRIMSDEDRLILNSDITWYKRSTVLDNLTAYNFYITTDFATSEQDSADYCVISVWAYDCKGNWFWVDGICKKQTMDLTINDLFKFVQMYKPLGVGIEVTGQQGGFIPWLQEQMGERNCYFTLTSENNKMAPGMRPSTDKFVRFQVVVPLFKANKIYFPVERKRSIEIVEAVEELSLISFSGFKARYNDFLDTLSMLPRMQAWKPMDTVSMVQGKDGYSDIVYQEEEHIEEQASINSYLP